MSCSKLNDFEKTRKLASYTNWPNCKIPFGYSPIQLVKSGFSYTGKNAIVKCDDCNVQVDVLSDDVISLSEHHDSCCKVSNTLRRNITYARRLPNENSSLTPMFMKDMNVYQDLLSIRAAPENCPCAQCVNQSLAPRTGMSSRDMFGFRRVTGLSLILSMRDKYSQNGPAFPEYTERIKREESINDEYGPSAVKDIARAGFFYTGCGKRKTCFCCGLCLCDEILLYKPWREHARWCPVCPYLLKEKSEQYVHNVIHDTRMLKAYYRGHNRPSHMDTDVITDALKDYPQVIITESIGSFFQEDGSFPTREELFHILKTKKAWRTFDEIPNRNVRLQTLDDIQKGNVMCEMSM